MGNNPINNIDPDGMDWYTNRFDGSQKYFEDNKWRWNYSHNEWGSYMLPEVTKTGYSWETLRDIAGAKYFEAELNQMGFETYRTDSRLEAFANMISIGALPEFKGLGNLFKSSKAASVADDVANVAAKTGEQYTKSSLKLGQEMHNVYKVGSDGIKEFRLPSGKRIDFLDKNNGIIYELKPFNPRAMKAGENQLKMYLEEIRSPATLQKYPELKGINWETILETY